MQAVEYGILCLPSDEKALVKNVNAFLATLGYRKMYKWAPSGVRDPDHPEDEPRYSHYYCQFLKQHPRWHFELYPNVDLDGKARFPERPDAGWTLFVNKPFPESNSPDDDAALESFFAALTAHLGFPAATLHRYKPGENRR